MSPRFLERAQRLPSLGLGLSTEYGAMRAPGSLDLFEARRALPRCASFLELGVEVEKGLDLDARRWVREGGATTYHFLDINLHEPEDLDGPWLEGVRAIIEEARPAWLCGDAGLWHFGPRAQGHMLLLPPILTRDAAYELADGVVALREATGLEVLPENPPGHLYVGDLHLLDFFAILCDRADTGVLLDLAHLVIFQEERGLPPTAGLDGFPLNKVIELHMAGGRRRAVEGLSLIEDDHTPALLPETWAAFEACAPQLSELRAVVFECERNPLSACAPELEALHRALSARVTPSAPLHAALGARGGAE
jgi:uncharacterized protein (UPF0276 family)